MSKSSKTPVRKLLEIALAFAPWVFSMYVLYWLEYGQIWTTETAHRGKISVAILASGMIVSFLVHSRIAGHRQK